MNRAGSPDECSLDELAGLQIEQTFMHRAAIGMDQEFLSRLTMRVGQLVKCGIARLLSRPKMMPTSSQCQ
jgi:hypothetical protein